MELVVYSTAVIIFHALLELVVYSAAQAPTNAKLRKEIAIVMMNVLLV